jgi:hypothetical protein
MSFPDEIPVAALVDALDLPPAAARHWFEHVLGFCARHGGDRHYAALMSLMHEGLAAAKAEEGDRAA